MLTAIVTVIVNTLFFVVLPRSWMEQLVETLGTCSDQAALERCGFRVDFGSSYLRNLEVGSTFVECQDLHFATYWRLVSNLLFVKAGSMVRYTCGCPGMLAGLLHSDPDKARDSFKFFEECVRAFEQAETKTDPTTKSIVSASPLRTTPMRWAAKFAGAGGFQEMTPQLVELLTAMFEGIGQTKICEDSIQTLRDCETRNCPSKNLAHFTQWQSLVSAKVIGKFGREEVTVSTSAPVDPEWNPEMVFSKVSASNGDLDSVNLRELLGTQNWTTYNSQTVKRSIAQMMLLVHAAAAERWDTIGEHWWTGVVPALHILFDADTKEFFMPVRVWDCAALLWPIREVSRDVFCLDVTIKKLIWRTFWQVDDLMVVPTKPISPLHLHLLRDAPPNPSGPCFKRTKVDIDVMKWQAEHGFPGLSESVLRKLLDEYGIEDAVSPALTDASAEDQMALALSRSMLPESTTQEELLAIMCARTLGEQEAESGFLHDLSDEAVRDVVILGDQSKTTEFLKNRVEAKTNYQKKITDVLRMVEHLLPKIGPLMSKAKTTAANKKADRENKKLSERWYRDLKTKYKEMVVSDKPGAARVHVDDSNGRFRCFYKGFANKSFSWHERGGEHAAKMALQQMWTWEELATGRKAPAHMAF